MKNKFALLVLTFFMLSIAKAQSADEKIIRNAMNDQLIAWNKGDISGFMGTYWKNDSLVFIGKNGVTYGWEKTKNNYLKSYPDTTTMGKLDFNIISLKKLSAEYFFVIGKWHLSRSVGDASGHFTLLFKKVRNKWMIVADHSS